MGALGLELAIVPHWDNAEGGTHDTRACFMGMERFAMLRDMLPATAVVLGIEEHTAVTLDLERGMAEVQGKGGVSILRGDEQRRRATGEFFGLEDLEPPRPAPSDDSLTSLLDGLLDLRAELRARGEWEMADSLRQHLLDVGIEVRDTPQGALWVRAS